MRIISFIDQPDVIKKIFQLEVSLKVKPSILPTAYHLEVDLSPLYRAVNLIKRLSAPKTFDLLDRVSFTTLKCHQEAGRLNHPHLLYQRFPPFPNHSNIDFFGSFAHKSPTNLFNEILWIHNSGGFYSMLISVSKKDYSPYLNLGPTSMSTHLRCYFLAFLKKSR